MNGNAISAIVIYKNNDKEYILLGKKRKDSHKFLAGAWHIPGGSVEKNESDEQALRREIGEEVGIEIVVGKYIGSSITPTNRGINWYECATKEYRLHPSSDLEDAIWVPKEEVIKFMNRFGQKAMSLWPKEVHAYFSI